jgi:hypothetical protein
MLRRLKQLLIWAGHFPTFAWLWGVGGAAVATALLGWLAQAQTSIPLGWLILGAVGVALLLFLTILSVIAKLRPTWIDHIEDTLVEARVSTFHTRLIRVGLAMIDLSGLAAKNANNEALTVELSVVNLSSERVTVVGLRGYISVDGDRMAAAPQLERTPIELKGFTSHSIRVRQVAPNLHEQITSKLYAVNSIMSVNLGMLELEVSAVQNVHPIPVNIPAFLRGPIRSGEEIEGNLANLATSFGSPMFYSATGPNRAWFNVLRSEWGLPPIPDTEEWPN